MKAYRKNVVSKRSSFPSNFMAPTLSSMMRISNDAPEFNKEKFFSERNMMVNDENKP